MQYERVQLDANYRVVDWNGPFLDREEAADEAAELVEEYRGIGWSVVRFGQDQFHAYESGTDNQRWILVRPM